MSKTTWLECETIWHFQCYRLFEGKLDLLRNNVAGGTSLVDSCDVRRVDPSTHFGRSQPYDELVLFPHHNSGVVLFPRRSLFVRQGDTDISFRRARKYGDLLESSLGKNVTVFQLHSNRKNCVCPPRFLLKNCSVILSCLPNTIVVLIMEIGNNRLSTVKSSEAYILTIFIYVICLTNSFRIALWTFFERLWSSDSISMNSLQISSIVPYSPHKTRPLGISKDIYVANCFGFVAVFSISLLVCVVFDSWLMHIKLTSKKHFLNA